MIRRPVLFDLGRGDKEPDKVDAQAREAAQRDKADTERAAQQAAARQQAEQQRLDRERLQQEAAERARLEREKAAQEQQDHARQQRENAARQQAEKARAALEQADREQAARQKADRDRQHREQAARDKAASEARARAMREDQQRLKAEQDAANRAAREATQKERAEAVAEQARKAQQEAARADAARAQAAPPKPGTAPRLFETDEADEASAAGPLTPATAPPVPDLEAAPSEGRAMLTMAALAARRPSRIMRFFWSALVALLGFVVSVAVWDFVTGLLGRNAALGGIALMLVGVVGLAALLVGLRELAAFSRLRRLDDLHKQADAAIASRDLGEARAVLDRLMQFYAHRDDTAWGRERLAERRDEVLDADGLLNLTERELLAPLDTAATREVEAAARTVATVTALVPIALADLVAALGANIRMIRRIAEIYGGRGGVLGSIRLARAVLTHLVATGMVAVGDDMISSVAGGGVLARISRRFGEGVVNGALTARVGVAAMEVCRPLPFRELRRPSVGALVKRALTGLFDKAPR